MSEVMEQPGSEQDSANPANAGGADQHDQSAHADQDELNPDLQSPDQAEEEEEIEIGDRKFALPKSAAEKLKAERLMDADYRRKTQALADDRRNWEAESRQKEKEQQQYIADIAKVTSIDDQLAELQKIDLTPYWDTDPAGCAKIVGQIQTLQGKRNEAANAVAQKQQQYALGKQQEIAKQVQEAEGYFAREIPGWNAERSTQLQNYANSQGIKGDVLAKAILKDPAIVKALDKAEKFDRLEKSRATKPAPAPTPAPVTRVGAARGTVAKDPTKMSDSEWMAARKEAQRKR